MMAGDAAPLRTPVEKEKVIVMDQEMEDSMMEILDAVETLCVGATTASSLVRTIMRKMIAVRSQQPPSNQGRLSDNRNKVCNI